MAECVFVLESHYGVERPRIAELMRAALALPATRVLDETLLLRTLALYAATGLDFVDAHLAATAELTDVDAVASFDRDFDEIPRVRRMAP